jgi:mannosyltransferase
MRTATAVDDEPDGEGRTDVSPDRPRRRMGMRRMPRCMPAWLPVGALVAVAGLLSLPRLGTRSMWLDETYTVGATNQLLDTFRHTAATQALYYLLVWPVSRLSTDPAWLRLPSALLAMAAVAVVHLLARRLGYPRREALLAAGGLALSWGLARYAVEARSYTLALLLVTTSWLALVTAVQADDNADADAARKRWWWAFWITTALVPLTHGLATLNYPTQLAALALMPDRTSRLAALRRALRVAPAVAVELAALFLLGASDIGDWVPPLSLGQLQGFKQLLVGYGFLGFVLGGVLVAAVVVTVRRYVEVRDRAAWLRLVPVLWLVGPALMVLGLSLFRPYAAARYIFPSLPAVFLLLAALVVQLGSGRRIAVAVSLIAALLLVDHRFVTTHGMEGWPQLMDCMAANVEPGDRVVTAASLRPPLDYYWDDHPELAEADVEPLSPPEPFGEVRRLYESRVGTREALEETVLADTSASWWYADRGSSGRLAIFGIAINENITAHYEVREPPWYFKGGVVLVRLDPIGTDRPRAVASCTTVDPPDDS